MKLDTHSNISVISTMKHLLIITGFFGSSFLYGQSIHNYPKPVKPTLITLLKDSLAIENSGMCLIRDSLWLINDSGSPACVYSIDTITGKTTKIINCKNSSNKDWEEIGYTNGVIYIGDFGNNSGSRNDLRIYKFKENTYNQPDTINFSYKDQSDFTKRNRKHDYDCEAFIPLENEILIFTKNWISNTSRVYRIPNLSGNHIISPSTTLHTDGLITGASYDSQRHVLGLCGYKIGELTLQPFLIFMYDFNPATLHYSSAVRIKLQLTYHQVEAIVAVGNGIFLFSNETLEKDFLRVPAAIFRIDSNLYRKSD